MDIRCHSPFEPLWFKSRDPDGASYDVVVVKATYDLVDERRLVIARDQEPVTVADDYYGAPGRSSVRYESDLAPFKPRTDVVVIGDAHAPGGEPARSWPVQVWLGERSRELRVHGPRTFRRGASGWTLSEAAPATVVPLRYELAFGGTFEAVGGPKVYAKNPIGVGYAEGDPADPGLEELPAPQIEAAGAPVTSPSGDYLPAGLGFTGRSWQPRLALAGTYDDAWKQHQWPLSPRDFDLAFYNGASPEWIVEGYLQGGETLSASNVTPSGRLRFEVPRWRIDARFRYRDGNIHRHATNLDTLVVDLPKRRVLLTHRVRVPEVGTLRVLEICMRDGA